MLWNFPIVAVYVYSIIQVASPAKKPILSPQVSPCGQRSQKSSVKVVASPRNQRYLRPRSLGAGVFVCEPQQGRQLAVQLDPERAVLRRQPDLFDQLPDCL